MNIIEDYLASLSVADVEGFTERARTSIGSLKQLYYGKRIYTVDVSAKFAARLETADETGVLKRELLCRTCKFCPHVLRGRS